MSFNAFYNGEHASEQDALAYAKELGVAFATDGAVYYDTTKRNIYFRAHGNWVAADGNGVVTIGPTTYGVDFFGVGGVGVGLDEFLEELSDGEHE